jgi:cell division septum initiation protein DivIVA
MQEIQNLQRENQDLRGRLKDISQKLSEIIESSKSESKQRATPDPRPEVNQEIIKKNLFYYE